MATQYAKKVFTELLQNTNHTVINNYRDEIVNEGIVTSVTSFIKLLIEANDIYNKTFNIPENKQIIFAEDFSKELINKLNNNSSTTDITSTTIPDIRVVTYLSTEEPAIISAHSKFSENGVRNIKNRFNCVYDDPEYTGYSIIRTIKDVTANITFKVWGNYFQDIRDRAVLLRDIIDTNIWYFKHKGLREITWSGSIEEETWDAKNVAKFKSEKYQIRFASVKELKEKNIEQIVLQLGVE